MHVTLSDPSHLLLKTIIMSDIPCTLPPELIDIVLDHLHDDKLTLTQCALVSRIWVSASHYHLFLRTTLRFCAEIEDEKWHKRNLAPSE